MPEYVINEATLYEIVRAREAFLTGMGGGLDGKRPQAWSQYGYKPVLSFADYMNAYERGGPAFGAVHRILDKCWQEWPRIKRPDSDSETPWETKLKATLTKIGAWQKLRDFDRRNMIGHYAGLIYRVRDGKPLREPMERGELVDLVPVYEDQLKVTDWNSDTTSEDFGKPTMWQYRMRRPQANNTESKAAPDDWQDVHPSRVQILAEGSVGDFLDGVPLLRAGFNSLVDLEKVAGGSGESFLKNSARTIVLKFDANGMPQALAATPGEGTPAPGDVKRLIEEKVQALNRNTDASIVLQGGEASTLQTSVADPEPSFIVAGNLFSASVMVPFTVLFGQQTGRLASDQDQKDMNARCKSRQVNVLTPALTELITRGQAAGWFESGEFEIEWPPLDAPGEGEKLDNAGKMADVNEKSFRAGQGPVFAENEIRKVAGAEPAPDLPDEPTMPAEGDPAASGDPAGAPVPAPIRRAA